MKEGALKSVINQYINEDATQYYASRGKKDAVAKVIVNIGSLFSKIVSHMHNLTLLSRKLLRFCWKNKVFAEAALRTLIYKENAFDHLIPQIRLRCTSAIISTRCSKLEYRQTLKRPSRSAEVITVVQRNARLRKFPMRTLARCPIS